MDSPTNQPSTPAAPNPAPAQTPAPAPAAKPAASAGGYISNPYALIKPTWEAFKLAWLNLLLIILTGIGATLVLLAIIGLTGPVGAILGLILAIPALIIGTGYLGFAMTKITIDAARGKKISFKESLPTLNQAWQFFATAFLTGLIVILGFILLIIPGIIFMAWFGLSTYYVVEDGTWGTDALKRSRDLVKGRFWEILGTFFMPGSIGIIGIIPILGALVYFAFTIVMTPLYAVRFIQLLELKKRPDWDKVPVSGLNYLALILGIVFSGFSYSSSFNKGLEDAQKQTQQQLNLPESTDPY